MEKHYHGHRSRLKEKFKANRSSLYDYEILELLLTYVNRRSDVKPIAKALLEKSESLSGLFTADIDSVTGAGPETSFFFNLIQELITRIEYQKIASEEITLNNPEVVFQFLKHLIGGGDKEQFVTLFLDTKNKLLGHKLVARGTVNTAVVYPREVAEEAIRHRASSVIISHNHPSGDLSPSPEDMVVTGKVKDALSTLDIALLDHIIVTSQGYFSFRKHRKL